MSTKVEDSSFKGKSQLLTIQIFLACLIQILCSCNFKVYFELLICVSIVCFIS